MTRRTRLLLPAAVVATAALVSGCGFGGVYNVPLPGGADVGSHPIEITAKFTDVLDLVPQSGVKLNNVAVGRVTKIKLEPSGKVADVTIKLRGDLDLPANAVASISQSSLLGEKYVALAPPTGTAAVGTLGNGAVIGDGSTSQNVQVEQVFGALSLLLNGGGLNQLNSITTQLNKATAGNEPAIRQLLASANSVVGQLNSRKDSITQALDGLAALSKTLNANNAKIDTVLADFSPGLKVLSDERSQLVTMLNALNKLSTVTVRTVSASQADLVADLKQLQPILSQLAASGTALPQSLQVLLTYPFPDSVLNAVKGDYLNVFITTNLKTPGTTIADAQSWPSFTGGSTAGATSAAQPAAISAPPLLLPSTSSVAPGLTSATLNSSPTSTASSSSTPSSSAASSAPGGSASATASGSATAGGSTSSPTVSTGTGSSSAGATSGGGR